MPTKVCPHCQVEVNEDVENCPHCQRAIGDGVNPYQSPKATASDLREQPWMSVISGLFFGASLAVWFFAPGLSILLVLLAIPTIVRSLLIQQKLVALGQANGLLAQLGLFLGSGCVVTGIGVAGVAAFVAVCLPTGLMTYSWNPNRGDGILFALGLGFIAAVVSGGIIARKFWWPRKLLRPDKSD